MITMQVEQSTRSTNRSFKKLISANGISPGEIYQTICSQTVDLVFTAHPTQVLPQPQRALRWPAMMETTTGHYTDCAVMQSSIEGLPVPVNRY